MARTVLAIYKKQGVEVKFRPINRAIFEQDNGVSHYLSKIRKMILLSSVTVFFGVEKVVEWFYEITTK